MIGSCLTLRSGRTVYKHPKSFAKFFEFFFDVLKNVLFRISKSRDQLFPKSIAALIQFFEKNNVL